MVAGLVVQIILFDLSERQFIIKYIKIECHQDLISLITKKIIEKNEINDFVVDDKNKKKIKYKDTSLINELIINCGDLINKYTTKLENEKNRKLYFNLENKFEKLNENLNPNNYNKIVNIQKNEKSYYEESSKNANNKTIVLGDIKNLLFKNNKINLNKANNNNINMNTTHLNNTINDKSYNLRGMNLNQSLSISPNKNISSFRNIIKNIKPKYNNFFNSPPSYKSSNKFSSKLKDILPEYMNSSNGFQENDTNNQNGNGLYNVEISYNSIVNIKENDSIINENTAININKDSTNTNKKFKNNTTANYELIKLPKLDEIIINSLSDEDYYLYNQIIEFLSIEYNSLNNQINSIKNKSINEQLYSIKESIYFIKYKKIFEKIYNIENEKGQNLFNELLVSKNNLDTIKNECDILFNDINSGQYNLENITEIFNNILDKIEIYKYNNIHNYEKTNQTLLYNNHSNEIKKNESQPNKNLNNINLFEDKKERKEHTNFFDFYNSYNPSKLSKKFNNTFTHRFFNFKKNNADLKFKLVSHDL